MDLVKLRIQQFTRVEDFVQELESLVSHALQKESVGKDDEAFHPRYYAYFVEELERVGWSNIHAVNDELTVVTLVTRDERGVEHRCTVEFSPASYQAEPPKVTALLPEEIPQVEHTGAGVLLRIFRLLEGKVKQYSDLWAMLDDFDRHTWVIEPKTPDPSITYRRVVLEENCSVQIQVSAHSPRSICDCKFLGKDSVVKPLMERFNRQAHQWDWEKTVRENLCVVLGITFPKPQAKEEETFKEECGICYMFELPTEDEKVVLPNQYCGKCGRPYHTYCLSEWLRSLPSTHRSFDTMFGKCVYCSTEIKVQQDGVAS